MPEMRNPWLVGVGLATMILPSTLLFLSLNLLFPVPLVAGVGCVVAGFLPTAGSKRNIVTVIGAIVCLATGTVPFALRAYGERSGKPIVFVLPDGFEGEFSIVKDSKRGIRINPSSDGGRWIFEIPPDGVLYVTDASPFHQWHAETARYRSGVKIEVEGQGVVAGTVARQPGQLEGSTEFDGTRYTWRVAGPQ